MKRQKNPLLDRVVGLPGWLALLIPALTLGLLRANPPRHGLPAPPVEVLTAAVAFICFVLWVAGVHRRRMLDGVRTLESLRALSWGQFEQLVGEMYRQSGWRVAENWGNGADGGVDLEVRQGSERMLVQCKQWRTQRVPVQKVRELWGVVASEGASGGIFVTCGGYTADAVAFARGKKLELIDGPKLLERLRPLQKQIPPPTGPGVSVDGQAAGPGPWTPLEAAVPTAPQPSTQPASPAQAPGDNACPRCGAEMVRRVARKGASAGQAFWGCSAFPRCRGTRDGEA